jgi:transposase
MRRKFSREFKFKVVQQLISGQKSLAQVSRENELAPELVCRWREQYNEKGEAAFPGCGNWKSSGEAARIAELEASLGRAHLEIEFLQAVIKKKDSMRPRDDR